MNDLRTAAQQALEALEFENSWHESFKVRPYASTIDAITALRVALAQEQAEPAQDQRCRAEPLSGGNFVCDCKIGECPGRSTAPPKAEPVQEPGAWVASPDGRVIYDDVSTDDGLLRVSGDFENDEQRLRYAQRIVDALNAAPPRCPNCASLEAQNAELDRKLAEMERAEPVAWRYKPMIGSPWSLSDDGYYISCKRDKGYTVEPLYTAPPQRTMVPLTDEEIDAEWHELDGEASALFKRVIRKFARAVEKASWEKNHGQA